MSAMAYDIASAVQSKLVTISGATSAVLDLAPEIGLSQITGRTIIVCPAGLTWTNDASATRSAVNATVKVNVALLEKVEKTELPAELTFLETVAAGLNRQRLTGVNWTGVATSVEYDPLYGADEWRRSKVFVANLTLTVKVTCYGE